MDKQTILVVDDTPDNIDVLSGVLGDDYKVKAALNGVRALEIATSDSRPDMILLDIMMPDMDGYEVIRRLKSNPLSAIIPVIFVTAQNQVVEEERGFALGAVDYITKPISPPLVQARVKTQLALYNQNRELERRVKERTTQLHDSRLQIIHRLGKAAEFKDNETGMHVIRMSHYTRILAEALELDPEWVDLVYHAAPMHDIGKIGIPDNVLLKPGKLDPQEWEIMKKHAQYGAEILGEPDSELIEMAIEVALSHHEKWNGSGYPEGLAGEAIPLSGRIVAIADVFDALTSQRPYKPAWPIDKAVALIHEEAGEHFDPALVAVFESCLPAMLEIRDRYAESAEGELSFA